MKEKDEELEVWFQQNITDTELIKWYKTKVVQHNNWLDRFEKTIEEKEAVERPKPSKNRKNT